MGYWGLLVCKGPSALPFLKRLRSLTKRFILSTCNVQVHLEMKSTSDQVTPIGNLARDKNDSTHGACAIIRSVSSSVAQWGNN